MVFNLKDILSTASKAQKRVKKAARVYQKAKEGKALDKDEQRAAKGLAKISKVLKKEEPAVKAPTALASKKKEGMGLKKYKEKKKYAAPDYFSRLLSAASPVKGTREPLKALFRAGRDRLTTPKGYTRQEAIEEISRQRRLSPLERAHGKGEKLWEGLSGKERESFVENLLKGKRERAEDFREKRKKYALTPRQAYIERGTSPIGYDEKSRLMGEGLRQSIGAFGRASVSSAGIGIPDVLMGKLGVHAERAAMDKPYIKRGDQYYDLERMATKGNQALYMERAYADAAPKVSAVIGALAGGAPTYSAIAGKIGKALKGMRNPVGDALARKPVFTTYLVQNPLEEIVEGGVRLGTGQEYTFRDFAIGLGTGSLFASLGLGRAKQEAINENMERAVRRAEETKGGRLKAEEFEDTILNSRLIGNKTGRDLLEEAGYAFGERRLAYKTGRKGDVPGITRAAEPEMGKLEAEKIVRERARKKGRDEKSFITKIKNFAYNTKTGLFDKAVFVEKLLNRKVKEGVTTKAQSAKFGEAYERSLRAMKLLDRFLETSGFARSVKEAAGKDIERVGEVMKAAHQLDVARHHGMSEAEYGKAFGTKMQDDKLVVRQLGPKYATEIANYQKAVKELNKYMVESGLVSAKEMKAAQDAYSNYVPLYRTDFEKVDEVRYAPAGEASISRQNVLQEFKGSDKPIKNPYESFIDKAAIAFREGERNRVAKAIADYADIKDFGGEIKKLKKGESAPYTIKYLEGGDVKRVAVPKEVHDFAKNVGVEHANVIFDASRWMMRGFKAGTTGMNPAFLLSNVVRDIQTAKIHSAYGLRMFDVMMGIGSRLKTGVAKTKVGRKLGLKEGKWVEEYEARGGGGTSQAELLRRDKAPKLESYIPVRKLPGKGVRKNIKYITKGARKIRDGLENMLSLSEEATRIGVLRRNYRGFLSEGYGHDDAMRLAMQEALDATANFVRGGRFKKVITGLYPYQSASFAGARTLHKSFKRSPAKTAFRIAKNILVPEATLLAWNMSDEKRRKVYRDIPGWEKDMNFIAITPWARWNEDENRWEGVIKIPKPPGLSAFTQPIRKEAERAFEVGEGSGASDWLNAVTGPVVGVNVQDSLGSTGGQALPHAMKIPIEVWGNRKFFTGKDIIPDYLQGEAPKDQYYDWTPDVYAVLGEKLGVSPLVIDHIVGGFIGSAGEQAIGAKDPVQELTKRFSGAYGGELEKKEKEDLEREAQGLFSPRDVKVKGKINKSLF
jgi:hypothetical protein